MFGEELRKGVLPLASALLSSLTMCTTAKPSSKVERGIKSPSRDLARLCDAALDANGELASLARLEPASRRQVLAAGALAAPAICLGANDASGKADHTDLLAIFRAQLDHYRELGQAADPAILVPVLAGQLTVIQKFAAHTGQRASQPLL